MFARFSRLGFNPTDDGFILAEAYRVARGAVPHVDLISPRPLGSAYLHVVDLWLPFRLMLVSRGMAVVYVVAYTAFLATLTFRRLPWRWNVVQMIGAAGAVLVNQHVFPLMPWHTTDGLLLVSGGFVLLECGVGTFDDARAEVSTRRRWARVVGLLAIGSAVTVKQSFFPAPVLALVRVAWLERARPGGARRARLAADVASLAAPALVYSAWVALRGGLGAMERQLTSARGASAVRLLDELRVGASRGAFVRLLLVVSALLIAGAVVRRAASVQRERRRVPVANALEGAGILVRIAITAVVVSSMLGSDLTYGESWGWRMLGALLLVLAWRAVVDRRFDGAAVLVALLAWMVSLSWGYANPNLLAGSVTLVILARVWDGAQLSWPGRRVVAASLTMTALVAFTVTARTFETSRRASVYFDRASAALTATLDGASSEFGGVRTNPVTARYVEAAAACVRRFPASRVAILPDNPGLTAVLGLRDPFPIVWMYPPEFEGAEASIVGAARQLARDGDYLVLFQTVDTFGLATMSRLPHATPDSGVFFHGSPVGERIIRALGGRRRACGPFVVLWEPSGRT
jgi:hypothetical protein